MVDRVGGFEETSGTDRAGMWERRAVISEGVLRFGSDLVWMGMYR